MVSDKGAKAIPWGKNRGCDKLCYDNWVIHKEKDEFKFLPHIIKKKMNLRQIIDLNIRIKTIKLLEKTQGKKSL